MSAIPVKLAVEDQLSEAILHAILDQLGGYAVGAVHSRGGYGYLKKSIQAWNRAAAHGPWIVLTDLDKAPCPLALIADWLGSPPHPNLLFRVAVREVESWVIADRPGFANFLQVSEKLLPEHPDETADPKAALIEAARKSRSRDLRVRIVPKNGSTATIGPEYNACLCEFVGRHWRAGYAAKHSPSLRRALDRLRAFTWPPRSQR